MGLNGKQWLQLLAAVSNSMPEFWQQPTFRNPIAISLGAIAGSLSRYYLGLWMAQRLGTDFPYGTFLINLTGCMAMGAFSTVALERWVTIPPEIRLLFAVGFLGSYTTFSTYSLDIVTLWRAQKSMVAGFYAVGSVGLGVVSFQLGTLLARLGR